MYFDLEIEKKQKNTKLNSKTNKIIQQQTTRPLHYTTMPAMINSSAHTIQRKLISKQEELSFEKACEMLGNTTLTSAMKQQLEMLILNSEYCYPIKDKNDILIAIKDFVRKTAEFTPEETQAIDSYQGGGYKSWNENLRKFAKGDTMFLKRLLKSQLPEIEAVISGINKIRTVQMPIQQNLHRVIGFSNKKEFEQCLSNFNEGGEYITPQFDSTSMQAGELMIKGGSFIIQFIIENTAQVGAEIALAFHLLQDHEREILLPPFTKYDVIEKRMVSPQKCYIKLRTKGVEEGKIQEIRDFINS